MEGENVADVANLGNEKVNNNAMDTETAPNADTTKVEPTAMEVEGDVDGSETDEAPETVQAKRAAEMDTEDGPVLYCLCKEPEDSRAMIFCDACEEWYHLECVAVTEDEAGLLETYVCPICTSRGITNVDVVPTSKKKKSEVKKLKAKAKKKTSSRKPRSTSKKDSKRSSSTGGTKRKSSSRKTKDSSTSRDIARVPYGVGIDPSLLVEPDIDNMSIEELMEGISKLDVQIGQLEQEILAMPDDNTSETEEKKKEDEGEASSDDEYEAVKEWVCPPHSVPICTDIRDFDFARLGRYQRELSGRGFDVVVMDPPWQLASANPTRGVAIGYSTLSDNDILANLPMQHVQTDGFLFVWVINVKYHFTLKMMQEWGYDYVDEITWVKMTTNRRLAKGHGFYLQHAKETILIGKKGRDPPNLKNGVASDIIFSERRGQSQKPTQLYEIIEQLVPGGNYLEIFGRRNNLRDHWVTVGNEL